MEQRHRRVQSGEPLLSSPTPILAWSKPPTSRWRWVPYFVGISMLLLAATSVLGPVQMLSPPRSSAVIAEPREEIPLSSHITVASIKVPDATPTVSLTVSASAVAVAADEASPSLTEDHSLVCQSAKVARLRNTGSFWKYVVRDQSIHVTPTDSSLLDCSTLASAKFYVRLFTSSGTVHRRSVLEPRKKKPIIYDASALKATIIRLKQQAGPHPASYVFALPSVRQDLSLLPYVVDVRLDFGYLPEGEMGVICEGDSLEPCLDAELPSTVVWSGAKVAERTVRTKKSSSVNLKSSLGSAGRCTSLAHLPGAWSNGLYLPQGVGESCDLLAPTISNIQSLSTTLPARVWLRFFGDSNTRYLVLAMGKALKARCKGHTFEGDKFAKAYVCWSAQVVLTFLWWHIDFGNEAEVLNGYLGDSLVSFLGRYENLIGWPASVTDVTTPHRSYVSLGSHAPSITGPLLHEMLHQNYTQVFEAHQNLRLLLVTALDQAHIVPAVTTRNNVVINAKNRIAGAFAKEVGVPVLDLFTITETVGPEGHRDWIHFLDEVYLQIGAIVMTDVLNLGAPASG